MNQLGANTVYQSLRPYPQYTGVTRQAPAFGNSHYHSLQMQLEKRTSNGVTALISYTLAKNLSDLTNADNAYNRQAERAFASFDVPQRRLKIVRHGIAECFEFLIGFFKVLVRRPKGLCYNSGGRRLCIWRCCLRWFYCCTGAVKWI